MLKTTAYAVLAIAITVGALHAYDRVRFGERTTVFFRMAFADEGDFRVARGRGGFERPSDSERRREFTTDSTRRRVLQRDSTSRFRGELAEGRRNRPPRERGESVQPPAGTGEPGEFRPGRGDDGSRGGRRRGGAVALEEVGYYALILSFVVMATYLADGAVRRAVRARQLRRRGLPKPVV